MTRLPDWPRRLAGYLDREAERPFDWGFRDCCLAASAAVAAMTLADPLQPFIGGYASAAGAIKAMRRVWDCADVAAVAARAAAEAGALEVGPVAAHRRARRGDLVLLRADAADRLLWGAAARPGGPFAHKLGIVALDGRRVLVKAPVGFGRLHLHGGAVERIWRYG